MPSIRAKSIYHMAMKNGWTGNSADDSNTGNGEDHCGRQGEQDDDIKGSEASHDNADECQSSADDALIDELASLSIIAYAKRRKKAAWQLGIGVTKLDKAVERRRNSRRGSSNLVAQPRAPSQPQREFFHKNECAAGFCRRRLRSSQITFS